jgi:hypothetical protein
MMVLKQFCSKCGVFVREVPRRRGIGAHHTCADCKRKYLNDAQARRREYTPPSGKPPTFAAIGQALGISTSAAHATYVRAMEKLRKTTDRELVRSLLTPVPEDPGVVFGAQRAIKASELPLHRFPIIRTKNQIKSKPRGLTYYDQCLSYAHESK